MKDYIKAKDDNWIATLKLEQDVIIFFSSQFCLQIISLIFYEMLFFIIMMREKIKQEIEKKMQ